MTEFISSLDETNAILKKNSSDEHHLRSCIRNENRNQNNRNSNVEFNLKPLVTEYILTVQEKAMKTEAMADILTSLEIRRAKRRAQKSERNIARQSAQRNCSKSETVKNNSEKTEVPMAEVQVMDKQDSVDEDLSHYAMFVTPKAKKYRPGILTRMAKSLRKIMKICRRRPSK